MNIKYTPLLVTILLLASCSDSVKSTRKNAIVYTGDFAGSPIELTLENLDDSLVKGESNHKGQISEMSGKRRASEKGFTYVMKELGKSQYEGVFDFELDTSLQIIFGSWQQADTANRTAIVYTLRPKLSQ